MKTIVILIMMLFPITASQAQSITFDALVKGVIDDAEIKKELILNGFTKITDASDSFTDTYAFGYDEEEEMAAIWVAISTLQTYATSGKVINFYMIDIQSFMPFIHDHLKEDIIRNCTFEGIEDNDVLVYKFKSKIGFNISSEDGTNMISVFPLFDPDSPKFEQEVLELQEQVERLNNPGRDAFGSQGVGESEGGEGITWGSGNQGDPNGSPDADNYGTGGGLGNGISYGGLGSRRAKGSLPRPNMSGCDLTQKIEVNVEVQVDRIGNVLSAMVSSATYQNKCIWDMVVEAAKRSKFTVDQNANNRQTGWIRYIIVP